MPTKPTIAHRKPAATKRPDRYVICGPPASGKTTWVREHRREGDLAWDFDEVKAVLYGTGRREISAHHRRLMVAAFRAVLEQLPTWRAGVYVIVTSLDWATRLADQLGAELIVIRTSEEECARRLIARDPAGARRDEMLKVIRAWHRSQPVPRGGSKS